MSCLAAPNKFKQLVEIKKKKKIKTLQLVL